MSDISEVGGDSCLAAFADGSKSPSSTLPRDEQRVPEGQETDGSRDTITAAAPGATLVNSPSPSITPSLPQRDSASSFVTAPDRNSISSTTLLFANTTNNNNQNHKTSSYGSKGDTMGSLSMARIAEESSSSSLPSSPSVSRPSTGPHREIAGGVDTADIDVETSEVLASTSSNSVARLSQSPRALSSRLSSSSLASSSSSSKRRVQQTGGGSPPASSTTRSISDKSVSRDSLHPVQTTISPSSPAFNSPVSPAPSSRSPRIQHSALASSANEQQQQASPSTRSTHSFPSQHSPLPTLTTESRPSPASNGETASSSTPRLNAASLPASSMALSSYSRSSIAGESHSHASVNGLQSNKEVFKIPITSSPSSSPSLPPVNGAPAYPQSHSSPNLQQQQHSHPQQQVDSDNAAGIGTGEAILRAGAPARYSHAGFSNTHPPVTASSQYAAAMHSQRSSAPILPPNAYSHPTLANDAQQMSDLSFIPSPMNRLSDAGFGSSSPYPPIGAQQQQRYSLPVQASTAIPTFTQPFPSYQGSTAMSPAASLRPQPTTSYSTPGQSKHLPEMHPSALEARPSISAPFPPSSSPPRGTKVGNNIAAPAAIQQRERPDTSRPLGQEICLECLMRDRDMADVEVTGPGVWSRNSDLDFEEALRAEEIAIANATHAAATNGGHTGSSAEDGNEADRRSYALHRNGSTEENYGLPPQNGRYVARDGGPVRSPSRESSVSDGQRGYRRQIPQSRRRLGSHDPLTSASLKLWTQMNHVSSAHRYKVLSDFVQEQTRHLRQERRAYEQSVLERDRADRAVRDSTAKLSLETRPSMSSGLAAPGGAVSPKLLDLRRGSKGRIPSMQLLPNGMTVETIDVQWDEKEAKARAKAASKSRRSSSQSPNEQRKSFAPSVKSFNALSTYQSRPDTLPSPTGSFAPPWMADERRRFSSPMLSSKYRNASSDNLSRNKQYVENEQEMRKSSYSLMSPPLRAMRSPSPSRQSFQTGTSQRESKGWRRSLWPRSATASVASFPRSGSMMEMHLGMSQDKHEPMPSGYSNDYLRNMGGAGMHAPGGTWPDNASELGEQGGISPDENVEAAKTKKQKKKRFQKLFNSLLGTHHHATEKAGEKRGRERTVVDQYASHVQQTPDEVRESSSQRPHQQAQRRQTSFNYATAAYQDDYSEPLAPPPPLSYLTGSQPHVRSYSSSSQSSVTAPAPPSQQQDPNALYQVNTRPNSLTVPRNNTNSSNGFASPSTSSSELNNRNRPSSVTSWRSSSNKTTGSPQSPRELLAESFGQPLPAIRQASIEGIAPGLRGVVGIEMIGKDQQAADIYKLRREKSLPALPPGEYDGMHPFMPGQDYALQQHLPNIPYDHAQYQRASSYGAPPIQPIAPPMHEIYGMPHDQYASQYHGTGSEWDYASQTREVDYDGANSIGKGSKKPKMRSRLFSFGTKKSRSSTSPPPAQSVSPSGQQAAFSPKGFAPHEAALQAVVRDQGDMIAYRYPSTTTHA